MKIALLAPIEESVPPKKYGGTERVVSNLAEELVKFGHQVDLYATGDSVTSANLIPVSEKPIRHLIASNPREWYAKQIESVYFISEQIRKGKYDVIHSHIEEPFILVNNHIKTPLVTTLHNPIPSYLDKAYRHQNFVSISNSQRKSSPGLNYIATVYNGIDINKYEYNSKPKDYLVFLGRISPDKGILQAIEIAKKTRHKLIIVAKIDPTDRVFYREKVKPLIDGKRIVYNGEVDDFEKIEILKYAKALLSPIQWNEPFGLVNIEALACGVPVLTISRGSIPEIFKDAKVGYLVDEADDLIDKIAKIDRISRKKCREHVENNFTSEIMAKSYIKAYKKAIRLKKAK